MKTVWSGFRAAAGGTAASTGTISRPEWTRFLLKCHVLLLASLTILNKTVTFGVARAAGRGCGLTRSGPRPAGASFTAAFCSSRCACARARVRGVEVEGSVASSHVTSPPVLPALGPDLFVVVAARLWAGAPRWAPWRIHDARDRFVCGARQTAGSSRCSSVCLKIEARTQGEDAPCPDELDRLPDFLNADPASVTRTFLHLPPSALSVSGAQCEPASACCTRD